MTTWTAYTTLADKTRADALADALARLTPEPYGVGVFEIEDGAGNREVGAYFDQAPDPAGLALLAALHKARDFVVSELPETDWVAHAKRELAPVKAGRFFVYGGHDADRLPAEAIGLRIEAAMAFGTGHHGTTRGCLLALDSLAATGFAPRVVADIGCGTAVLAMAAARLWQVPTIASDIDEIAVEVARTNLRANRLERAVTCVQADGFDTPEISRLAPFDLVFANILKGPLIELAPAMAAHIAPRGSVIISGILSRQTTEVAAVYSGLGFNTVELFQIVDWATLILRFEP